MTRTQLAILPFGLTSFWLGKSGEIAGIDGIVFYLILAMFVSINVFVERYLE